MNSEIWSWRSIPWYVLPNTVTSWSPKSACIHSVHTTLRQNHFQLCQLWRTKITATWSLLVDPHDHDVAIRASIGGPGGSSKFDLLPSSKCSWLSSQLATSAFPKILHDTFQQTRPKGQSDNWLQTLQCVHVVPRHLELSATQHRRTFRSSFWFLHTFITPLTSTTLLATNKGILWKFAIWSGKPPGNASIKFLASLHIFWKSWHEMSVAKTSVHGNPTRLTKGAVAAPTVSDSILISRKDSFSVRWSLLSTIPLLETGWPTAEDSGDDFSEWSSWSSG